MYSPGVTLATKGILNNGTVILPTSGFLVLSVEQGVVPPGIEINIGGAGYGMPSQPRRIRYDEPKKQEDQKKKYYVRVTFQYENEIYTQTKYTDKDVKISVDDIELEIVDKRPVVKINVIE